MQQRIFPYTGGEPMNPYQILDISPTATREEIRSAYRTLARRWHPDRFAEGPERDWANEKMAEINAAYRFCTNGTISAAGSSDETQELQTIEAMVSDGKYDSARRKLLKLTGRSAEWNYLLGLILLRTGDIDKACIYLSIAAHQKPDDLRYVKALQAAKHTRPGLLNALKKRFSR